MTVSTAISRSDAAEHAPVLCHLWGTRAGFANRSGTRGITPGPARASNEKSTGSAGESPSAARAAVRGMADDITKILGGLLANRYGPSPSRARDGNSPLAGTMCRNTHEQNVRLRGTRVNPVGN